jgi:hypothetical protein
MMGIITNPPCSTSVRRDFDPAPFVVLVVVVAEAEEVVEVSVGAAAGGVAAGLSWAGSRDNPVRSRRAALRATTNWRGGWYEFTFSFVL